MEVERGVLWMVDEVRTSQERSTDAGRGFVEVSFCEDEERPYFHDPLVQWRFVAPSFLQNV